MLRKAVVWGGIAFVIFFVAFRPSSAAATVGMVGQAAIDILQGIGDFFRSLAS